MHPEQRRGIVSPARLLHPHLVIEERRTLGEKDGKGTQRRVRHRVALVVAPLAHVRQLFKGLANLCDQDTRRQERQLGRSGSCHGTLQQALKSPY